MADEEKLRKLIVDYLREQKLMQLATVSGGSPWVCSVWFGFDDELNIYFFSSVNRRHSIEVEKDRRVAGAVAKPHTPEDTPRGIQFEGVAVKLTDENDVQKARSTYQGRIFNTETIDNLISHKERPHSFYKVTPAKYVLFDVQNFPDHSRRELIL